ncbi:hypothetical protein [Bacteriovorax sp. DB6_IX]|uniref:hypothetical protein n=1 Tax=Bacteriovorax sp. DB6_IX TaxID=1353530 RepID=UPI00038A04B5|nr:hypothetical protein [Bacteriovorax sp. DB6_IX]EQC52044.1 hypothetical protein M901_0772 [Bacteriovorax sp. DB6_IX]
MTQVEISQRAQEVLSKYTNKTLDKHDLHLVSDKFLGADLYFHLDEECNFQEFAVKLDESHSDAKKHSLLCAALELVSKVGIAHLFKVSFRETESYLRDENHLPAWEDITASRKWFNEAIEELISGLVNALLMKQGALLLDWDELNLMEKIEAVEKCLEKIRPVYKKILTTQLELVTLEEDEIIISGGEDFLSHKYFEVLMTRIVEYLQFSLCSTKIKLVAQ